MKFDLTGVLDSGTDIVAVIALAIVALYGDPTQVTVAAVATIALARACHRIQHTLWRLLVVGPHEEYQLEPTFFRTTVPAVTESILTSRAITALVSRCTPVVSTRSRPTQ